MTHHSTPHALLPASARLAWWGTAWLRGAIGPDDLLDAVVGGDVAHVAHVVVGDGDGIVAWLARQRRAGADAVAAAFPASGDPVGLRGPADLNAAAIEAGEAALVLGTEVALVPAAVGRAVEWTPYDARRRPPPDLGDADRRLRAAVLQAARELAALDVARWSPDIADELVTLRGTEHLRPPPGVPERCVDVAGRALRLWRIVDLAAESDGAAVGISEMQRRREAIRPLEQAARLALTAAFSPDGWPH